ncbi:MAG: ThuA domain-containing protein [Verrucomicrobiales bacterium]|nr:ThuA domain-containing protein [Verrucomicrobiales bacterium]
MRKSTTSPVRTLTLLSATAALIGSTLIAQQQKKAEPQTWEEKKAARFPVPTDEQKKLIADAIPAKATAQPAKARKILVMYRCEGFIHTSIPFGNLALDQMAAKTGAFSADVVDNYDVFTAENLAKYDAILFNNTTGLKPNPDQQKAILDFVNNGGGVIGIHAAADNFGSWPEGIALIGGIFNGHPWGAGGKWAFKNEDPKHPLMAAFGGKGFWHTDEIYWYKPESFEGRERLRVLFSLDMSHEANRKPLDNEKVKPTLKVAPEQVDVPVSWCRQIGKGRLFYTNLGHRDDTFWNAAVMQHLLDGIQYALGDLAADATPSAQAKLGAPVLAPAES